MVAMMFSGLAFNFFREHGDAVNQAPTVVTVAHDLPPLFMID